MRVTRICAADGGALECGGAPPLWDFRVKFSRTRQYADRE